MQGRLCPRRGIESREQRRRESGTDGGVVGASSVTSVQPRAARDE